MTMKKHKIAIFASGQGSNAVQIINYFRGKYDDQIQFSVWSNKIHAPVLSKAESLGVNVHVFSRKSFTDSNYVLDKLHAESVDYLILAGFILLVPKHIIDAFPYRIINIHPALLPKYGGKGMYGIRVHEAVKRFNEAKTGITIHYVNEEYDSGQIIFQASCPVIFDDTPSTISRRVRILEHTHFPRVIESILLGEKLDNYHIYL